MKNVIAVFLIILLSASCNKTVRNNIAYVISEKDLIPEGITYSSTMNAFFISSIHKTKIVKIDAKTGEFADFISSDLLGMRFLGMIVDEARSQLWACGNKNQNGEIHSVVVKFNLKTGEIIKSYSHIDIVGFTFNDLVLDKEGNVYATNSSGQDIYKIDHQSDSIALFFEGVQIAHPNGISISPDNKYLFIASNDNGIRVLDIKNKVITGDSEINKESTGIDGLKYYHNSLIGIQNEVKKKSDVKIARYFLDESGTKITKVEIIDQDNPFFNIPTTFVIVEDKLYCLANSQLGNLSYPDIKIIDPKALKDILILEYDLKN